MKAKHILLLLIILPYFNINAGNIKTQDKQKALNINKRHLNKLIIRVNEKWQKEHTWQTNAFWDNAVYQTGNIEAYKITKKKEFLKYSENWAAQNKWSGATSRDKSKWKYKNYGEDQNHVLFADWQICFQSFIDLYNIAPDDRKISRTKEVCSYQINTDSTDYWWWVDALYMAMPVMSKIYRLTGEIAYITKLEEYFSYTDNLLYNKEKGLYYRDKKYVPETGKDGDFWARGNGWAFAAFAKTYNDLPEGTLKRKIKTRFTEMAEALKTAQTEEGYWTRNILKGEKAPGRETSGTALFTYGLFWGINNGLLNKSEYINTAKKAWMYLQNIALQKDYTIGYVQPIGEKPGTTKKIQAKSVTNFGTGVFLLAASEVYNYIKKNRSL